MADADRDGKTLNGEPSNLRRFYRMKSFLQPEIYMDNMQQRMYETTIDIQDKSFLNLHSMFNDFIDRIKSEKYSGNYHTRDNKFNHNHIMR